MSNHKQILSDAREAEGSNPEEAAKLYEEALKEDPDNEQLLHRLMVLYRKTKSYKKELAIINKAIKLQQKYYKPSLKTKGIIAELSKKLNLSTGLVNKKGDAYTPDAIAKLEKRKDVVLKKLN